MPYFLCRENHHYAWRGARCNSVAYTSRTQATSPWIKEGAWKPYRRVVDSMWLGYMAFHKYFNYTGLINTPLCEVQTSCAKRTLVWLLIALHYCILLLSHFSNDKPACTLEWLFVVNCSQEGLTIYSIYPGQGASSGKPVLNIPWKQIRIILFLNGFFSIHRTPPA